MARAGEGEGAALEKAQAIRTRLAEMEVVAPCDCTVEVFELRPGDLVSANAPAVALLDRTRLWVRAYVPEMRLGQVRPGMAVPVRVDGFGQERFGGRVTYVATQAEFTPRNVQTPEERSKQVFRIKVTVEDAVRRLRPGMSADVLFDEAGGR